MYIAPHPDLIEHGRRLLKISDLRERLRYYNDNICSLSYPHGRTGFKSLGCEDLWNATGDEFFSIHNLSDADLNVYLEVKQNEIDRLKSLMENQTEYRGKLKTFFECKAGQVKCNIDDLKVYEGDEKSFKVDAYFDSLIPRDTVQIKGYNDYLVDLLTEIENNPSKYHWLWLPSYKQFDIESAKRGFISTLADAVNKYDAVRNKQKEIENRYNLNRLVSPEKYLYTSGIDNDKWETALFNDFYNGYNNREYDYSRRVLTIEEVAVIRYVKSELEFYEWLQQTSRNTEPFKPILEFSKDRISGFNRPKQVISKTRQPVYTFDDAFLSPDAKTKGKNYLINKCLLSVEDRSITNKKNTIEFIKELRRQGYLIKLSNVDIASIASYLLGDKVTVKYVGQCNGSPTFKKDGDYFDLNTPKYRTNNEYNE